MNARVLVVDDDLTIAGVVGDYLQDAAWRPGTRPTASRRCPWRGSGRPTLSYWT